jgi:hypothetical protein
MYSFVVLIRIYCIFQRLSARVHQKGPSNGRSNEVLSTGE